MARVAGFERDMVLFFRDLAFLLFQVVLEIGIGNVEWMVMIYFVLIVDGWSTMNKSLIDVGNDDCSTRKKLVSSKIFIGQYGRFMSLSNGNHESFGCIAWGWVTEVMNHGALTTSVSIYLNMIWDEIWMRAKNSENTIVVYALFIAFIRNCLRKVPDEGW